MSNVTLPDTGGAVATDNISVAGAPVAAVQRVKPVTGTPGMAADVAPGNGMPVYLDDAQFADMMHFLESLGITDQQQRQKICMDAVSAGVTLPVSIAAAIPVGNIATFAGIGNELFINMAESAYADMISANLKFT